MTTPLPKPVKQPLASRRQINFKLYRAGFLYLVLVVALAWIAFLLFGESLIHAMYEGRSIGFLNEVIDGRHIFDADHYVGVGYKGMIKLSVLALMGFIAFVLLDLLAVLLNFSLGYIFFCSITTLCLSEIILFTFMHNPSLIKSSQIITRQMRTIYREIQRDVIQYNHDCAHYDEKLTYTLKPGTCEYHNIEFHTKYSINSLGFRDDEDSLVAPDIVVVGDSFSMGWGVEQEETYANIIEKTTGMKVLNTGISSYGTVREMKLLDQLDTTNLKYLVVQYHYTDIFENKPFYDNNNELKIGSRSKFEGTRHSTQDRIKYFPGKYTFFLIKHLAPIADKLEYPGADSHKPKSLEAFYFANALKNGSSKDLRGVQLIVMVLTSYCIDGTQVLEAIQEEIEQGDYPAHIKNAKFVNMSERLTPDEHCFVLDDHMNAKAHAAVADELEKVIRASDS